MADQNNIGMEVEVESDEAAPFAVRLPLIPPVKSPRKRKRNVHLKKVHRDQKRRNEGREYKTKNGKLVESRTIGEMCNCPLKCKEKVSPHFLILFGTCLISIFKTLIFLAV